MARTTVRLTFRGDTRNDPIIYRLGQDYKVVTNIRRADVGSDTGWGELDLGGETAEIDRALEDCPCRGIRGDKLEHQGGSASRRAAAAAPRSAAPRCAAE